MKSIKRYLLILVLGFFSGLCADELGNKEQKNQADKERYRLRKIKAQEDAEYQRLERELNKLQRMDERAMKEKKRRRGAGQERFDKKSEEEDQEELSSPQELSETEREKRIRKQERTKYGHLNRKIKDKKQDETVRLVKMKNKEIRQMKIDLEHNAGAFADLYKSASWPFYALYYPTKTFITLTGDYQYASGAYDSDGDSGGIERLVLGEGCIRLKDISLASNLLSQGLVTFNTVAVDAGQCIPNTGGCQPSNTVKICVPDKIGEGLLNLANNNLFFKGREDRFELSFDISRYIFRQDLIIGIQLPVVYNHHRLQASIITKDQVGPNAGNNATIAPILLTSLFQAKGITELGGSAGGIGDITLFARVDINAPYIDKLVTGLEVQAPTGKKASTCKLWAPELGNGGFWEIGLFGAVQFDYKQYINPHVFMQVTLGTPANLKRRVPKLITSPTTGNFKNLGQFMALGDHILLLDKTTGMATSIAADAEPFSAFDTCIAAVADNISCVRITPGTEFNLKIGNMFEKFISRRGFLDIFYDFRTKAHDHVSGLSSNTWNLESLRARTQRTAHIIGTEYSYQFDRDTRFRAGIQYTFAGKNVAQTLEVSSALNYSF